MKEPRDRSGDEMDETKTCPGCLADLREERCLCRRKSTSGYVGCACRDCMDIAIADNEEDAEEAMCLACIENDCTLGGECKCPDAYGGDA